MSTWLFALLACNPPDTDAVTTDSTTTIPPVDTDDTDIPDDTDLLIHTGEGTFERGDPVTDSFVYAAPMIDVLFVIDASSSMFSRTETLKGALDGLITDWLTLGLEFQVGVTNIDDSADHGRLEQSGGYRWSDAAHPAPGPLLQQLIDEVGDPSSTEAGRAAAYKAYQMADGVGEPNEGFLRTGSQLAVIMHTDETDQSGSVPVTSQEYIDYLLSLRPEEDVSFHSIVATSDYLDITTAVGGVGWNVFNTPYGPALQAITDTFHQTPLVLTEPAIEDRIVVRVLEPGQKEVVMSDGDWVFDDYDNTVELVANHPASGATVEIDYETPTLP